MKRITALLVPMLACAPHATPSPVGPAPAPAAAPVVHSPAELEDVQKQWMTAMLGHDRPRLEALMAPEYVLRAPAPGIPETPRAKWLENLFTALKIDHFEQTDIAAHVYGEVGVVTSTYAWAGSFHDKAFDAKGTCTDVWQAHEAQWQVVSRTCIAFPGSATLAGATAK